MINGFGNGDPWEYLAETTPETVCLWVVDLPHTPNKNSQNQTVSISLNYKIIVFDLTDNGERNENDVLSDTMRIALDVLSVCDYKTFSDLYSFSYTNIKPFTERFKSITAGHEVDVTFKVPYDNNICQIPLTSIPTIN